MCMNKNVSISAQKDFRQSSSRSLTSMNIWGDPELTKKYLRLK